jgi:hypothetical protein
MRKSLVRLLVASTVIAFAAPAFGQGNPPAKPSLDCKTGPISKTYGGTRWLVYSCNDDHSVVAMSQQGNPAGPFYFMFYWENGRYRLIGEGAGDKRASDLALADLKLLSERDIEGLRKETGAR